MMASTGDPAEGENGLTNEDLQDLHEDILDRNEDGVQSLLAEFLEQDLPIKELCCTEVELEPATQDHQMNWFPLTAIHRAALIDSHGILDAILSSIPDVNINIRLQRTHRTPLHLAAAAGVLTAVNFLTSQNADVEAEDSEGATPMHLAAVNNNKDVMSLLCVRGASVNTRDKQNQTPLHVAAEHGHVDIVDFLLGKDLKVMVKDITGRTALHLAQVKGHMGITERLLERGIGVNVVNNSGDTPIHSWLQHLDKRNSTVNVDDSTICSTSLAVLVNNGADINLNNHTGDTPLHLAARSGNMAIVKFLLDQGGEIEAENGDGQTPLFLAQTDDVCGLLLDRSAGVDVMDYHGNTVLHVYTQSDDVTSVMMQMVINAGADLNGQNFHGCSPLFLACEAGNKNKIELLLNCGARMDILDSYGRTVLHASLPKAGDDVLFWLLGKNGINLMQQDSDGVSLLHLAAQFGYKNIVDHLITRNVDINCETSSGETAATIAANNNHLDIVRVLLLKGGSIDPTIGAKVITDFVKNGDVVTLRVLLNQSDCNSFRDENNQTALHSALDRQYLEISKLLLENSADIEAVDCLNRTPLHVACQNLPEMEPLLMNLISFTTCSMTDTFGNTPLHYCVKDCNIHTLELFSREGYNVNTQNKQLQTVSHVLLSAGSDKTQGAEISEKIDWLQNRAGFNVNLKDQNSYSILHLAVMTRDAEVVQILMENKYLEIDIKDAEGRSPLHLACGLGLDGIATVLLERDAEINSQDLKGKTPLFHAVEAKGHRTVNVLLNKGCDINIQDQESKTAIMLALALQLSEICYQIIHECSPDLDKLDIHGHSLLHYACKYGCVELIEELINQGADVNARNHAKSTPLHEATINNDAGILRLLINSGSNKNVQDISGNTAIHLCSQRGSYEHVKVLIDCEADMEIPNKMEYTPLHMAAMATDSDVMQLLVANEADFDVIDSEGKTPLILSIVHGNTESSTLLLGQGADVSIQDDQGDNALHHAMRASRLDIKFMKLLFHRGRKLAAQRNTAGQTAFDVLKVRTDIDIEALSQDIGLDL